MDQSKQLAQIALIKKATDVQTLIFDKEKFTRQQATQWVKDHDFKVMANPGVDETADSYRIRQIEPSKFVEGSFRTIDFRPGIKAVIGRVKE